jgi:hypothetical protein
MTTTTTGTANTGTSGPATPLQTATQSSFVTLNLITQACHAILNTTFVPPTPAPSWFADLNTKLDAAKANAQDWIDNIAPGVTGGVPLQVINYGTTYDAMSQEIQSIVQAHPNAQGADDPYVKQVAQLVSALQETVEGIIANADQTATTLSTWGDAMQASHDALSTGAVNIQSTETSLSTQITQMNTAISTLNATIAEENKAIAYSAAGIGVGLLLTVVGIALAPETGGASLLVAGTGGLLVIGGAVTWGIMQSKINDQYKQVAADQQELADDQRQLVALQGLASASSQAIGYITTATSALSDFRTSWTVFQGELQGVCDKLQKAETSLSTILEGAFTQAASNEWNDATAFAQSLADAPVQIAATTLPMQGSTAA